MVIACTVCANAALKICALCQSQLKLCCSVNIKLLHVIPKSATFSNGFCQVHKHPENTNTKETYVFLPIYCYMSTYSFVPASVFLIWL